MSKRIFMLIALIMISLTQLNVVDATGDTVYTVTFLDWDGEVKWVDEVAQGSSAYRHEPTRIGYDFVGWSGSITNVQSNLVVTAIYTPKLYQIDFITLDGSVIVRTELGRDYEIEELTPATALYFNLGWTPDEDYFYEDPIEKINERVFIGGNVLRHVVVSTNGTQVDEYVIEVDGYELIGWDGDFTISGPADITALFSEETDDNVVVNPEDPEEEIIDFTLSDMTLEINDLLEATVETEFMTSVIDSLVNFLEEDVLVFPELDPGDAEGVSIRIPKQVLVYAEDRGVDIQFSSVGYEILIPNESLSVILDSIISEFVIEIREPSLALSASFDLGDYTGALYEAIEINLSGSATPINDFEIEVTIDSEHDLVVKQNDEYVLLSSISTSGGSKTTLENNGVLYRVTLTEKTTPETPTLPNEPEERFDAIQWLKDLDTSWIIVGVAGSYLFIYMIVYAVETIRERN